MLGGDLRLKLVGRKEIRKWEGKWGVGGGRERGRRWGSCTGTLTEFALSILPRERLVPNSCVAPALALQGASQA